MISLITSKFKSIYNLMALVHWSSDVMYVKNDEAAAEGGVMMAKIPQAMSSRSSSLYSSFSQKGTTAHSNNFIKH